MTRLILILGALLLWAVPTYAQTSLMPGATPSNFSVPAGWSVLATQGCEGATPSFPQYIGGTNSCTTTRPHSGAKSIEGTISYNSASIKWGLEENTPGVGREVYLSFWDYSESQGRMNTEMFIADFLKTVVGNGPLGVNFTEITVDWFNDPTGLFNSTIGQFAYAPQGGWVSKANFGPVVTMPWGVWTQWEIWLNVNTPNLADGFVRVYKNGTLFYSLINYSSSGAMNMSGMRVQAGGTYTKQIWRYYTTEVCAPDQGATPGTREVGGCDVFGSCACGPQPPVFKRFLDDMIVLVPGSGGGGSVPDTTPPTPPTNVALIPAAQITVNWTPGTDFGGLASTTILRCTPSPCTPIVILTSVSPTTTTYADTTVTGGVGYSYSLFHTDLSGNKSTNTSPVSATALVAAVGSATTLTLTADGHFAFNGVPKFLIGVSFFDCVNYRTADIDSLAANGFNLLVCYVDDVLRNNANSAYNANGTIKAAKQTAIAAFIDYADSKGMVVDLNCVYADTDGFNTAAWITVGADMTSAVTNCVNAFKAKGNVMFSVVNEHNYGTFADTEAKVGAFMATARAACATCLLNYSSSDNIAGAHIWTTRTGSVVNTTAVQAELANGVNVLTPHEDRTAGWNALGTARVSNLRAYLDSIGRQNVPIFLEEPGREGNGALGSAAAYVTYAQNVKAAGAAGWVMHTAAGFAMSVSSFLSQTTAVENTLMSTLAAGVSSSIGQVRDVALVSDTFTRANNTDLGVTYDAGYTGATNLQIVSNAVFSTSTTLDAVETNNAFTPAANQWAQATVSTWTGAGLSVARVGLRWANAATKTGYVCTAGRNIDGTRTTLIEKWVAGTYSELVHNGTVTWAVGDVLGCEVNGQTLTAYRTATGGGTKTAVATATDTSIASGKAALFLYNATASQVAVDDFSFGNFTTPVAYVTPKILTITPSVTGMTYTSSGSLASVNFCTDLGCTLLALAQTPGGVIARPYVSGETFVCLFARDSTGAQNNVSTDYKCANIVALVPTPDVTAPIMSNGQPDALTTLPQGTTSWTISLQTNEVATCRYATTNIAYNAMDALNNTMTVVALTHSATVTGLSAGTFTYYVQCIDPSTNATSTALLINVVVAASTTDLVVPSTVTNAALTVVSSTQLIGSWDVATDLVLMKGYRVFLSSDAGVTYLLAGEPTTNSLLLVNLTPGTLYYMKVLAEDASLNVSAAYSNVATATTLLVQDVTPPTAMSNLRVVATYARSVLLAWDAGTDTQGSVTSIMEQCTPAACSTWSVVKSQISQQSVFLTLAPSTTYCWRGLSSDSVGNPADSYSNTVCGTTKASGLDQPRRLVLPGMDRLPRLP